jgi:5'-deoxynucleotidase YfbR-like HD superfamily hydrolase
MQIEDTISSVWHINLLNGRAVDIRNLQPDDIYMEDMVHAICQQNRYLGRTAFPYSVGHHSILVEDMVLRECGPSRASFCALIHDFGEAFYHDLSRGIKRGIIEMCPEFKAIMEDIDRRIYRKFNLHDYAKYRDVVKKWDNAVAVAEKHQAFNGIEQQWPTATKDVEPADVRVSYMLPSAAKETIIARFKTYQNCIDLRGW